MSEVSIQSFDLKKKRIWRYEKKCDEKSMTERGTKKVIPKCLPCYHTQKGYALSVHDNQQLCKLSFMLIVYFEE